MRKSALYMRILAYAAYFPHMRFWKCHYMRENMRFALFAKICDRIFAYNQHP